MARRWSKIAAGFAGLLVLGALALPLLQVSAWCGYKTLDVQVRVVDTDARRGVEGATIEAFDGPTSPLEGLVPPLDPSARGGPQETCTTDESGYCRFKHRFFAYGRESWCTNTGGVRTSDGWIKVSAPDRPSTLVPLDRQTEEPRDLHDESPIIVTVVLNKPTDRWTDP